MANPQPKWDRCLIIGHGEDVPDNPPKVDGSTLIIAADGGLIRARQWGLVPHWLLGDFDSLDPGSSCELPADRIIAYPAEKDQTDLELAVDFALGLGVREIVMTGVWGGRIDHSLGNIEILCKLAGKHVKAQMITSSADLYLVDRSLRLELPIGTPVSLLPLTSKVTGVTTSGLYYALQNAVIKKGSTKTISNYTVSSCMELRCETGVLLAIVLKKDPRQDYLGLVVKGQGLC